MAVIGAAAGEFVGAEQGLGYLILTRREQHEHGHRLRAVMAVLSVLGMVVFEAVGLAERLGCAWSLLPHDGTAEATASSRPSKTEDQRSCRFACR